MKDSNNQVQGMAEELLRNPHVRDAEEYYQKEEYENALSCYKNVHYLDFREPLIYARIGDCYYKLRKYSSALNAYEKAIEIDLNYASIYNRMGCICVEAGYYNKALHFYEKAIQIEPDNATSYNGKGQILRSEGRYEDALHAFNKAIELSNGDIAEYHYSKGMVLYKLQQHEEALITCEIAHKIEPHIGKYTSIINDIHNKLISKQKLLIDEEQEVRETRQVKTIFDHINDGNNLYKHNQLDEALEAYDYALQIDPQEVHACAGKANVLVALKRFGEALQIYDIIFHKISIKEVYVGKGQALTSVGRLQEALEVYNQALATDSTLVLAHEKKGQALFEGKRFSEALIAYDAAIKYGTNNIECYTHIGGICFTTRRFSKAILYYKQALQLDSNCAEAHLNLGQSLFESGQYNEAISSLNIAIALDAKGKDIAFLRIGDALTILGKYTEASDAYRNCLTLACDETHFHGIWYLADTLQYSRRPANVQVKLYQYALVKDYSEVQANKMFAYIGGQYGKLFNTNIVKAEDIDKNIQTLYTLLTCVPEIDREQFLQLCIQNNSQRTIHTILVLARFGLSGLTSLVLDTIESWDHTVQQDETTNRFYQVLPIYQVPEEKIVVFFGTYLVEQRRFEEAEQLLAKFFEHRQENPDILWLLALVLENLKKSPHQEVELLQYFVSFELTDKRIAIAYQRIGDIYGYLLQDGNRTIEAYKKAEINGCIVPQLQAFRQGNWDTIPALQTHPDYNYPPVIALDLENDYVPDAPDGSRVVEIAAVRAKGCTELDTYQAVVKRSWVANKVSQRQNEAKEPKQVVKELETFFAETYGGTPILVGHNIQAFDVVHLRAMGFGIHDDQLVDTLVLARHLYPDSLHHNLGLLCNFHDVPFEGKAHTALPDARACLHLLHALGEELIGRDRRLVRGFRAFTAPNSAFDKAILQPRGIAADPAYIWELDPTSTTLRTLVLHDEAHPSPNIVNAIENQTDALIERYDIAGSYVRLLPKDRRSTVVVNTRSRLERMQATLQKWSNVFVLPNFQTLLCPRRLGEQIKQATNNETKLSLFCLYQASHNHDAQTLYPLRFPTTNSNDENGQELAKLREILLASCCSNDAQHTVECTAMDVTHSTIADCCVLLATHEGFIQQELQRQRDLIIVDDADELQMHFAEYLAERITSKQIATYPLNDAEREAFKRLKTLMDIYVDDEMSNVGFHERVLLQNFVPYLKDNKYGYEESILSTLEKAGPNGKKTAQLLGEFERQAPQKGFHEKNIHVYWLDLQFAHDDRESTNVIEEWGIYGMSKNLHKAFQELFLQPYKQHIICGTAISLGNNETTFFRNYFDLPKDMVFCSDKHPPFKLYIPTREEVRPASFLAQYSWATSVGSFLYRMTQSKYNSILVTLHTATIADALLNAFDKSKAIQVLSPKLGWTIAKIAERIEKPDRQTLTFVSPRLRQTRLQEHVDVEITGPMRFMNQRDPLVAAQMLIYAKRNKGEVFTSYLLPQALLELKARVSSSAELHIILDSSLREGFYEEQVRLLFDTNEILKTLPAAPVEILSTRTLTLFNNSLSSILEQAGLGLNTNIAEKDLLLTLKTLWKVNDFRVDTLNQKNVVQNTLAGKDQLVIAPTGGGKSLCFQLPAILMAQDTLPKVTIIFSPLVALMKDQVQALHNKGIFCAMYFDNTHSGQDYLQGIKQGDYSIIYVAPEKIHNPAFCKAIQSREIGLIAIDEAHCVSQWGHNFRTDYFAIKHWLDKYTNRSSFPLLALTATARKGYVDSKNPNSTKENSTIGDVIEKLELNLKEEEVIIPSLKREELKFEVEHIPLLECTHPNFKERDDYCKDCREDAAEAKFEKLIALLTNKSGLQRCWDRPNGERQRGLIYCAYTKTVEDIKEKLQATSQLEGVYGKLRIGKFHGKMDSEDKDNAYKRFVNDGEDGLDIIIATNAFGMGIDVRRLSFVIHFDVPGTPEAYYQEAGRAGRDAEFRKDYARCILLYNETDLKKQKSLNNKNNITIGDVKNVYVALQKWCNNLNANEAIIIKSDLGILANVNEEKIDTVIHYLEHNIKSVHNDEPVVKRAENNKRILQLKFEQGYKLKNLPTLDNAQRELLYTFETANEWKLNEQNNVDIDTYDLLVYLNTLTNSRCSIDDLDNIISGLIKASILVHQSKRRISWKYTNANTLEMLEKIQKGVFAVFGNKVVNNNFKKLSEISLNLTNLYDQCMSDTPVNRTSLELFLFALSRQNLNELRFFELFQRDTSRDGEKQQNFNDKYFKIKLWGQQSKTLEKIAEIFLQLQAVVQEFAPKPIQIGETIIFDLLKEASSKYARQQLDQKMYLLHVLGVISYTNDYNIEGTLKIELLQKDVLGSNLNVDMEGYEQAKTNAERKLLLMGKYTTLPEEERAEFFEKYFRGEIPLA